MDSYYTAITSSSSTSFFFFCLHCGSTLPSPFPENKIFKTKFNLKPFYSNIHQPCKGNNKGQQKYYYIFIKNKILFSFCLFVYFWRRKLIEKRTTAGRWHKGTGGQEELQLYSTLLCWLFFLLLAAVRFRLCRNCVLVAYAGKKRSFVDDVSEYPGNRQIL